ncbi:MAG: PadR family transcriptional regulator [Actinobacteria bacterium]|nr:PadR family transcriptional regulator [Actinomycetota bacterium]
MCGHGELEQGCCCEEGHAGSTGAVRGTCHCGGNIPRHFVLPAVLFLLDREPSHGYSLLRKLSDLGIADPGMSPATVYRILSRLEEEGLAFHEHADDGQGPTRKVYSLTDEGRKALAEWRSHIERTRELLDWFTGEAAK